MRGRRAQRRARGVALVEFALTLPLLMFFLLGIIEFGLLVLHKLTLEQAAREGTRVAAVRRPTGEITERIRSCASALPHADEIQITLSYSTSTGQTYTLGNTAGENNAPPGSLVRARVIAPYHLTTGSFFSGILGAVNNTIPMQATTVMRRE